MTCFKDHVICNHYNNNNNQHGKLLAHEFKLVTVSLERLFTSNIFRQCVARQLQYVRVHFSLCCMYACLFNTGQWIQSKPRWSFWLVLHWESHRFHFWALQLTTVLGFMSSELPIELNYCYLWMQHIFYELTKRYRHFQGEPFELERLISSKWGGCNLKLYSIPGQTGFFARRQVEFSGRRSSERIHYSSNKSKCLVIQIRFFTLKLDVFYAVYNL